MKKCPECGRVYEDIDLMCIDCKTILGPLPEVSAEEEELGVSIPAGFERNAGFWIRFVARVVDYVVLQIVSVVIYMILLRPPRGTKLFYIMGILYWVVVIFYYTLLHGRYGQTLGKMLVGIKVLKADGAPISYARAFCRWLAEWLSAIPLFMGYIMVAFHPRKRALHDLIAGTKVIYVEKGAGKNWVDSS